MEERAKILALLNPKVTKKFIAPNRFVRSATYLASASEHGAAGKAEAGRVSELAAGGVGTIVSGFAYISEEATSVPRQWGLHNDERTEDVRLLAEAAHKHGAKFIVQLVHSGGQRLVKEGAIALTPSGLPHPGVDSPTVELTLEGLAKIRRDFAAAALRAKMGGADGVEIHGGHGFIVTQFLSPLINKRTDKYGGAIENRCRMLLEIFDEVSAAVGEDFPIWCKLSIEEGCPGGYPAADGLFAAKRLLERGIDGIEVSSGASYSPAGNIPSMIGVSAGESEAPFKNYAAELKKCCSEEQLIILTGGVRSLPMMADIVYNDICDLVGLSRPLLAEPDLINRWYEEDDRPAACISCNACLNSTRQGLIDCPVLRDRNEGNWAPL